MLLSCSVIQNVWIDRLTTCRDVAVVVVVVVVVVVDLEQDLEQELQQDKAL